MRLSLIIDAESALPVSAHMAVYASHNPLGRVTSLEEQSRTLQSQLLLPNHACSIKREKVS